jgi:hypothetical protein
MVRISDLIEQREAAQCFPNNHNQRQDRRTTARRSQPDEDEDRHIPDPQPRHDDRRQQHDIDISAEDLKIARAIKRYQLEFGGAISDNDYPEPLPRRQPYPNNNIPLPPQPTPPRGGLFSRRKASKNRNDPLYEYGNGSAKQVQAARPSRWPWLFMVIASLFMIMIIMISLWAGFMPKTQADLVYSLRWLHTTQGLIAIEVLLCGLFIHAKINS